MPPDPGQTPELGVEGLWESSLGLLSARQHWVSVLCQPSLSGQVSLGNRTAYCHQADRRRGQTSLADQGCQADLIRRGGRPPRCLVQARPSGCPLLTTSAATASWHCGPCAGVGVIGKCSCAGRNGHGESALHLLPLFLKTQRRC